jgi:hypothetical protein
MPALDQAEETKSTQPSGRCTEEGVRRVIRLLRDAYGSNNFGPMVRQAGDTDSSFKQRRDARLKAWAATLASAGKTDQQLAIGALRTSQEVRVGRSVTAADVIHRAEFRPSDVGLPSADDAYQTAVEERPKLPSDRNWPDAVAAAALRIKSWDWRHMDAATHRAAFDRQYQAVVDAVGHGAELHDLLPAPGESVADDGQPSDEATAKAALQRCRQALATGSAALIALFLLAESPQNLVVPAFGVVAAQHEQSQRLALVSGPEPAARSTGNISEC